MMVSFDTNILVHATLSAPLAKTHWARDLLVRGMRTGSCILLLQTLAEFSSVAIRKAGIEVRWGARVSSASNLTGLVEARRYAALLGPGRAGGCWAGCGGAEAAGKLLRPRTNNKRLRHLSIIASNRSRTPRSRIKRSTVA